MKKFWLFAALLFGGVLLAGCDNNVSFENNFDLETELGRIEACADRVGFYLNTNDYEISWDEEDEGWASFIRNWHVIREKDWETAEDDIQCIVDMVDWSVNIEFTNHIYNWELQDEHVCTSDESCDVPAPNEESIYTIVGPTDWYSEEIEAWKLILRKGFEDHTDIIFIEQTMWQNYLDSQKIVYWDQVVFKWEITSIDWAAWTHYYNADSIEQLEELFNIEA